MNLHSLRSLFSHLEVRCPDVLLYPLMNLDLDKIKKSWIYKLCQYKLPVDLDKRDYFPSKHRVLHRQGNDFIDYFLVSKGEYQPTNPRVFDVKLKINENLIFSQNNFRLEGYRTLTYDKIEKIEQADIIILEDDVKIDKIPYHSKLSLYFDEKSRYQSYLNHLYPFVPVTKFESKDFFCYFSQPENLNEVKNFHTNFLNFDPGIMNFSVVEGVLQDDDIEIILNAN